ncbi:DnaJ C-terminal domain-containing protein [Kitasatospora griseola]|uniref:DnaJ C-terminal domain-containing protein n=1 Tax=Kitasatospora griseola TaxID=2064 RepID=UPI0036DC2D3F
MGAGDGGGGSRCRGGRCLCREVDAGTGLTFPETGSVVTRRNEHDVRVPAGVREGQRLRLRGLGGRDCSGDLPGDLYVTVRVEL